MRGENSGKKLSLIGSASGANPMFLPTRDRRNARKRGTVRVFVEQAAQDVRPCKATSARPTGVRERADRRLL